ncbi:hypothetical protein [Caulobacter sp. NIBR1757]|uniref:hypothetical protein n=1 Tax=Caulobacter sp. NIBR1757 TaxID=3016000 RepID=UPI0022F0ADCA|nr:hypothetical protein [Caulobacter sp. NIBR1757]WGM40655.1 hypothetical protein AMEJIAPC_03602 [Caulobacter sp. NIBR1757]
MNQTTSYRRPARELDLDSLARQALQPWADAYETWRNGVDEFLDLAPVRRFDGGRAGPEHGEHRDDWSPDRWRPGRWGRDFWSLDRWNPDHRDPDRCGHCGPDPCGCRCCVSDADMVVEVRPGERRILSLIIENPRRRARDIQLDLSSWTRVHPGLEISGDVLSDREFKLEPCGAAHVSLAVEVRQLHSDVAAGPAQHQPIEREMELDRCLVSYADLRIQGCDIRSVRLALAILPRDCGAHRVNCSCGCC